MRVTQRSGRVGTAAHNDRSFDTRNAEHINNEKTKFNPQITWDRESSFEKSELNFYQKFYQNGIEKRNQNYRKNGHKERCKTVEEVYRNQKTRPEELILQIGDMDNHVNAQLFSECVNDYICAFNEWNREHGKHGHILSVAIHLDEATPHAHIRRVWDYRKDNDPDRYIGQNKALEQSGVPLPNPNKPIGRYNNRKITLDTYFRSKWQEICMNHGLQIETEPRPDKRHKQKAEYITDKINENIEILELQQESLIQKNEELEEKGQAIIEEAYEKAASVMTIDTKILKAERDAEKIKNEKLQRKMKEIAKNLKEIQEQTRDYNTREALNRIIRELDPHHQNRTR